MKRWLLSLLSGETLERTGLWLIIGGLLADAWLVADALLIGWLPSPFEKPLTILFNVAIATGVWIEHVGMSDIAAAKERDAHAAVSKLEAALVPRKIDGPGFLRVLEGKPKAPVEIVFVRDDPECWQLAMEIRNWLKAAGWQYSEPSAITGPDESRFASYPSSMQAGGQPKGVTVVQRVTSQADFERERMESFDGPLDTPGKALAHALIGSLGSIGGSMSFETGTLGKLRVVVGPKP